MAVPVQRPTHALAPSATKVPRARSSTAPPAVDPLRKAAARDPTHARAAEAGRAVHATRWTAATWAAVVRRVDAASAPFRSRSAHAAQAGMAPTATATTAQVDVEPQMAVKAPVFQATPVAALLAGLVQIASHPCATEIVLAPRTGYVQHLTHASANLVGLVKHVKPLWIIVS